MQAGQALLLLFCKLQLTSCKNGSIRLQTAHKPVLLDGADKMPLMQGNHHSSSSATTTDIFRKSSWPEDASAQAASVLTLTVREHEKVSLSIDQIKNMPWTEFVKLWKDYVNHLAVCLVESDGNADSPSSKRLEALVEELGLFANCLATSNPRSFAISRYIFEINPDSCHSLDDQGIWQQICVSSLSWPKRASPYMAKYGVMRTIASLIW